MDFYICNGIVQYYKNHFYSMKLMQHQITLQYTLHHEFFLIIYIKQIVSKLKIIPKDLLQHLYLLDHLIIYVKLKEPSCNFILILIDFNFQEEFLPMNKLKLYVQEILKEIQMFFRLFYLPIVNKLLHHFPKNNYIKFKVSKFL